MSECRCVLDHRGFAKLGEIVFRRSAADEVPSVIVPLGGKDAVVPLRPLQREWGIDDDSDDGRMLALIAEALGFVTGLRLGDPLPSEVLTGEASWEPGAEHRNRALSRLERLLAAWHAANPPVEGDQAALHDALGAASRALHLGGSEAVRAALDELADELAFIEALRAELLQQVRAVLQRLDALVLLLPRGDSDRADSLKQSRRLTEVAEAQLGMRFVAIDAQTEDVLAALGNVAPHRMFIRSSRDWLHRSRLAWEPILSGWKRAPARLDEVTWHLIGATYRFLAPRFMTVQEWQNFAAPRRAASLGGAMRW